MKKYRNYRPSYHTNKSFSVKRSERKSTNRLIITSILGAGLIYLLFTWVLPTLISGLSILNKFKSSKSKVVGDENVVITPPVLNIPFEATNTASIQIKGYSIPNSKVEIYVDEELANTTTSYNDGTFTADSIKLAIGINNITGKSVDESGSKSLLSKNIRIIYDNDKPKLELTSPQDNQIVKGGNKIIMISGATDAGGMITANDIKIIVNLDGNFSQNIDINDGENTIVVNAIDQAGNVNSITRKIIYQTQ